MVAAALGACAAVARRRRRGCYLPCRNRPRPDKQQRNGDSQDGQRDEVGLLHTERPDLVCRMNVIPNRPSEYRARYSAKSIPSGLSLFLSFQISIRQSMFQTIS